MYAWTSTFTALCLFPVSFSSKVLHTHLLDFDAAGALYDTALKLSGENPLVQRACGLFLLSSCRFPSEQSRTKGLALLSAADYRCATVSSARGCELPLVSWASTYIASYAPAFGSAMVA